MARQCLWLLALTALAGSTGCCRWCDRWCGNHHQGGGCAPTAAYTAPACQPVPYCPVPAAAPQCVPVQSSPAGWQRQPVCP